jgi:hypothetical protein
MPITPPALELFGIQAAVGYGKKQCERFATLPGFRAASPANDLCVLWTLHPRPAYEVVYEVAILGSDEEARDAIERNPAAPIPVVSSPEAIAGVRSTASGGSVTVQSYRNGAVDLRTRTSEPAVLVARHKWHPGWTAEVDGRPVPLLRAVGMYMAIVLPAGEHEVRLRYHEPGLRTGLAIAGAWLILTIGAGFVERRRRGRASPAG